MVGIAVESFPHSCKNMEILQKITQFAQGQGQGKGTGQATQERFGSRRSIFVVGNNVMDKRRESVNIRRISVLPVYNDDISDGI